MPSMRGPLFAALLAAALAHSPDATAHVTASPPFLAVGEKTTLTFDAPNERRRAMTGLELAAPAGVEVLEADAPPGWRARVSGNRLTWSGGRIAPGATALFPARLRATAAPGSIAFRATQRFEDGAEVRWQTSVSIVPAPRADNPEQHLGRALVAAVSGVAVIAGSLVLLRRTRRGSLQEE
jgi:hypothetical protein